MVSKIAVFFPHANISAKVRSFAKILQHMNNCTSTQISYIHKNWYKSRDIVSTSKTTCDAFLLFQILRVIPRYTVTNFEYVPIKDEVN